MLESLPTELSLDILQLAAETLVITDRSNATSLATTSRTIYDLIKPILYRRAVVTRKNIKSFEFMTQNLALCGLIRELTITWPDWEPDDDIVVAFTALWSLSGIKHRVSHVFSRLPLDVRSSITRVGLWNMAMPDTIPPAVTHVCLYLEDFDDVSVLDGFREWIGAALTLTHLGLEIISHREHSLGSNDPVEFSRELAHELAEFLKTHGDGVQQLAIRVGGWLACDQESWTVFHDSIRSGAGDRPVDARIRIWRDCRTIHDYEEDTRASVDDALGGVDIWTESSGFDECSTTKPIDLVPIFEQMST